MIKKILISRVDNIGDVALTLPLSGCIKARYPGAEVFYLVKNYTSAVCRLSRNIDGLLFWDEIENIQEAERIEKIKSYNFDLVIHVFPVKNIAKLCHKAQIPTRVGTAHRMYNWRYCNKLSFFSRKNSELHEAQLNVKLLESLDTSQNFDYDLNHYRDLINIDTEQFKVHDSVIESYISKEKFNLILHPKSFGSALEWPLESYRELVENLDSEKFNIIISGTKKEEVHLEMGLLNPLRGKVKSCVGQLSLDQLMALLNKADGIIAASTGPLHLGALLGLNTLGLFPSKRPMFPQRWLPIGPRVSFLLSNKNHMMDDISVKSVRKKMIHWEKLIDLDF